MTSSEILKDLVIEKKQLSGAAISFVNDEYSAFKRLQADKEEVDKISTLVEQAVQKYGTLLFEDPQAAMEEFKDSLPAHLQATVLNSIKTSYIYYCRLLTLNASDNQDIDIDAYIEDNEKAIRSSRDWKRYLVPLSALDTLYKDSDTTTYLTIHAEKPVRAFRRQEMSGCFEILADETAPQVRHIHSSNAGFLSAWSSLTQGCLRGLNWDNVVVAGGFVASALHCISTDDEKKHINSDMDLYIHGLYKPAELEAKVREIADVYKKNLPPNTPFLITKNTRTVTFFSEYPRRRVQIVLKVNDTPADVLLNFDLDACGFLFDGTQVYMLPRTLRSLETSMNVFTMSLVCGSWLGDRRETQDQRLFKYAKKGFGLRFLPKQLQQLKDANVDINELAKEGRARFNWLFRRLVRHYGWDKMPKDKNDDEYGSQKRYCTFEDNQLVPSFTHALLDPRTARNDPSTVSVGRNDCLGGFRFLMKHVALWEADRQGICKVHDDEWALDQYADSEQKEEGLYSDHVEYNWDKRFSVDKLKEAICNANGDQKVSKLAENVDIQVDLDQFQDSWKQIGKTVYAEKIDDALTISPMIPLVLPLNFYEFAKRTVAEVTRELDNKCDEDWLRALDDNEFNAGYRDSDPHILALFTLKPSIIWQKIDRRIDLIIEMLWSFATANAEMGFEERTKLLLFYRQVAKRRGVREAPSFVDWVTAEPPSMDAYMAVEQGFFSEDDEHFNGWYRGLKVSEFMEDVDEDEEMEEVARLHGFQEGWEGLNAYNADPREDSTEGAWERQNVNQVFESRV